MALTITKSIESEKVPFELMIFLDVKGDVYIPPCINVYEDNIREKYIDSWDNDSWVFELFESIKKKKKNKYTKELKQFCKENSFDYKLVKKELKKIYKASKALGFWN